MRVYIKLKVYIKIEETIIKFDDIKIPKEKLLKHKRPSTIKNLDIDKKQCPIKSILVKKDLNTLLTTKKLKN